MISRWSQQTLMTQDQMSWPRIMHQAANIWVLEMEIKTWLAATACNSTTAAIVGNTPHWHCTCKLVGQEYRRFGTWLKP